jgi:hypothetical protein
MMISRFVSALMYSTVDTDCCNAETGRQRFILDYDVVYIIYY